MPPELRRARVISAFFSKMSPDKEAPIVKPSSRAMASMPRRRRPCALASTTGECDCLGPGKAEAPELQKNLARAYSMFLVAICGASHAKRGAILLEGAVEGAFRHQYQASSHHMQSHILLCPMDLRAFPSSSDIGPPDTCRRLDREFILGLKLGNKGKRRVMFTGEMLDL
jgi:hypothetical protein